MAGFYEQSNLNKAEKEGEKEQVFFAQTRENLIEEKYSVASLISGLPKKYEDKTLYFEIIKNIEELQKHSNEIIASRKSLKDKLSAHDENSQEVDDLQNKVTGYLEFYGMVNAKILDFRMKEEFKTSKGTSAENR